MMMIYDWLVIKVELVFGPQGQGITRVFVLLNWFFNLWESLDEGVWWTCLSSVVDVSSTSLSQLGGGVLTNLCLKIL